MGSRIMKRYIRFILVFLLFYIIITPAVAFALYFVFPKLIPAEKIIGLIVGIVVAYKSMGVKEKVVNKEDLPY